MVDLHGARLVTSESLKSGRQDHVVQAGTMLANSNQATEQ